MTDELSPFIFRLSFYTSYVILRKIDKKIKDCYGLRKQVKHH